MLTEQALEALRAEYTDSLQNWQEIPNEAQKHFGRLINQSWQKTRYVARNLPFAPDRVVICPPHSALNLTPNQQHRADYATGVWEGSSAEPKLDKDNNVVGINVILHQQRLARMLRSLRARGYTSPIPMEKFSQMILDLVAIHGLDLVKTEEGHPARAYIRPSLGTGIGPWGISFKPNHFIESSVLTFRWASYFNDEARIAQEGLKAVVTGVQRLFPIMGKHASNYGAAAMDGSVARKLAYDELIYLAPYCLRDGGLDFGVQSFAELMKYGVLADGPGEEIIGVLQDGATLVYPPLRVNRLGGTVLDYLVTHLAPKLGFQVREQDLTMAQIRSGAIAGLAFVGNAVKVTPVGTIDVVGPDGTLVESLVKFSAIHPAIAKLRQQFLAEISGQVSPSHESLLTPVDLAWGAEYKTYLDQVWQRLGF